MTGENEAVWLEPVFWVNRRTSWRYSTDVEVSLRFPHDGRAKARLLDLSTGGCRVRTDSVHEGQFVWILLGNGERTQAEVVWARDGEAGFEFCERLPREVVERFSF